MRSNSSKLNNITRRKRWDVQYDNEGAYYNFGQVTQLSQFFCDADNKIVKIADRKKLIELCERRSDI